MSECAMRIIIVTLVIITVVMIFTRAGYQSYADDDNFANVSISNKPRIVLYYTPWCRYSTKFINGAWKSFHDYVKTKLDDKLIIESVCCTDNHMICDSENIKGYPTVILYVGNDKYEFVGNNTFSDLVEFTESVLKLNNQVIQADKPKIALFFAPWCGHCKTFMNNGWKQFVDFHQKNLTSILDVVTLSCEENNELCKEIGVRGYPTVILFANGKKIVYDGDRTLEDILYFLSANL